MEEMGGAYYDSSEQKPGEPSYIFVSKVPEADRQKALTEAFTAAKTDATRLAKAAGMQLGDLRGISSTGGYDSDDVYENQHIYRSRFSSYFRQQIGGRETSNEAVGMTPGTIKYKVTVTASFTPR